jgi:hypothetical protein
VYRFRVIFVLALALTVGLMSPVLAQEKMGDKRVYHLIKSETFEIPDKEGHLLVVSETHGYDLQAGRTAINRVITDLVKGNGRVFGYGTATEQDGDLLYYSFDGKVTTVANASGKPATSSQGTWVSTGGTGKWHHRDARGSFKNAVVGPGTSVTEWEGSWETKK